jgi:hypothetical protein
MILLEQSIVSKPTLVEPEIKISEYKLRELWSKGILSDLAYVAFALELQGKPTLDIVRFSYEWSVEDLDEGQILDGWKAKTLKIRSILNAMCVLSDKGLADCDFGAKVKQLSLFD